MLYSQISGFGVFRSRLYFKIRVKNSFLFHSDTNFNGGNKTPTPSRKRFFGQSSSFPVGRAYSPKKYCLIYSSRKEGCLPIKKEKNKQYGEYWSRRGLFPCFAIVLIQHLLNIRLPIQGLTTELNVWYFTCCSVILKSPSAHSQSL